MNLTGDVNLNPDSLEHGTIWLSVEGGLTKREWMAALAMQGLMANPNELPIHIGNHIPVETRCALVAVALADALIEALNTPAPKEGE